MWCGSIRNFDYKKSLDKEYLKSRDVEGVQKFGGLKQKWFPWWLA